MAEQNTITQPVTLQVPSTVKSLIEALIFGAREPLSVRQIQALYEVPGPEGSEPRKIDYDSIARLVEELNGEYTASDRPYRIVQIAGGYQFATQPAYAEWLGKLYKEQTRRKLSQSSIETLAIIAYKQPITKPEIESIRGVNCDYVLSTLLEKDMATIVGRAPTVGRPLLYGTTKEFLKHFGLNELSDLPRPREIQDILGDGQFETERRMLEAEQGLLEEKKEEEFKSRLPHIPKRKAGMDDDVKIFSKKRSREIKVRPSEDVPESQAEELKEEAQLTLTPEAAAPILPEESIAETPVDAAEPAEIPTIENSLEVPDGDAEQDQETSDSAVLAESLKYLDLSQRPAGTIQEPQQEVLGSAEAPAAESLTSREPERSEVVLPGDIAAEESIELHETAVADVVPTADQPPVVPASKPQAPDLGQVPGIEQDHHHDPSSKSRWTSWKEKIQGFIKKLFG